MRWMCWILAGAVLSMPVAAEQKDCGQTTTACTSKKALEDHLVAQGTKAEDGAYVIAYDHERGDGWWSGYRWRPELDEGCRLVGLPASELELRSEGHPRLTVPKGARLYAFVVGTNPYAYTVTAGDGKEVDHEDLAELQTLALLIGSTAGTAASVIGSEVFDLAHHVSVAQQGGEPAAEAVTLFGRADIEGSDLRLAEPTPTPLQLVYDKIHKEIKTSSRSLQDALTEVKQAADALKNSVEGLEAAERYLRAVETRDAAGLGKPFSPPSETAFHDAFVRLRTANAVLEKEKPTCPKELGWLLRAAELRSEPLPTVHHPRERRAHLAELEELVAKLGGGDICGTLRPALNRAASWLRSNPPTGPALRAEDSAILKVLDQLLSGYLAGFEKRNEPLAATKKLLEKGTDLGQRTSVLAHLLTRKPGYVSGTNCHLTHGVLPVARAEGAEVSVPWNKVRTETFTIAFDENLKGIVAPTRAKREEKYELQVASPWRNFDIDLGLVHSNIRQHTYSAVAATTVPGGEGESVGASEEGGGEESSPPLQIARTQSEKLSGDIAMFVSWLPPKLDRGGFSAGPQIGVGLDSDHPAAFAGFVFSIGRYLNLSGGWSWQEVEDLVPTQDIGTVVTSNDDIRTRKRFENGWYASLAITLDDLPFFGGGEED